jgi:hypothetical protein
VVLGAVRVEIEGDAGADTGRNPLVSKDGDEQECEVAATADTAERGRPGFSEGRVLERDDAAQSLLDRRVAELLTQMPSRGLELRERDAVRCFPDPEQVDDAVRDDATQLGMSSSRAS